jgi:hypothetical protein
MAVVDCIRRPRRLPLARKQAREGEQPLADLLQAVGYRAAPQAQVANSEAHPLHVRAFWHLA